MRSLLDVNVVISLLDPDHDFHARAQHWWSENRSAGWALCPLTENGVVRIMSHPGYNPKRVLRPGMVTSLLRAFAQGTDHEFWPDALSFLDDDVVDAPRVLGIRQVTDLYLLGLAAARDQRLATFDESIHLGAVRIARQEHLVVI
jgi:toxin-antitoxin system PIN domain toxin